MPARTPVYFISHGGPNVMEETSHPAYAQLQEFGREITQKVKPKAIIVISAHWQASHPHNTAFPPPLHHTKNNSNSNPTAARTIQISLPSTPIPPPLIYDFAGFPPHYYRKTFPHRTSPQLAERILQAFVSSSADGSHVEAVPDRGLDHGVWAPFSCMFDPAGTNPLGEEVPIVQVSLLGDESEEEEVPIVQVSLLGDESEEEEEVEGHFRVREVLRRFREEGCVVIGSGMAVHNLRDLWLAMAMSRRMGERRG
ncbi:hypothetical protein KC357_g7949 [Hortaea werneckii]|nr:hypothetical protein KC357_g7949 [Hortaea werneckii]